MNRFFYISSFFFCLIGSLEFVSSQNRTEQFLDGFQLSWTVLSDRIEFTARVKTSGWVGIGLNTKKSMEGAQLMIAGVRIGAEATTVSPTTGSSTDGSSTTLSSSTATTGGSTTTGSTTASPTVSSSTGSSTTTSSTITTSSTTPSPSDSTTTSTPTTTDTTDITPDISTTTDTTDITPDISTTTDTTDITPDTPTTTDTTDITPDISTTTDATDITPDISTTTDPTDITPDISTTTDPTDIPTTPDTTEIPTDITSASTPANTDPTEPDDSSTPFYILLEDAGSSDQIILQPVEIEVETEENEIPENSQDDTMMADEILSEVEIINGSAVFSFVDLTQEEMIPYELRKIGTANNLGANYDGNAWNFVAAYESSDQDEDTFTEVVWQRILRPQDQNEIQIVKLVPLYVMVAYGETDNLLYHGPFNRGTRFIDLLSSGGVNLVWGSCTVFMTFAVILSGFCF